MDVKHVVAHGGRTTTGDLFTQPCPFFNVFFSCLGHWLFVCMPVPGKKTVIPVKTVITITTNRADCCSAGARTFGRRKRTDAPVFPVDMNELACSQTSF